MEKDTYMIKAMEKYGGSFVKALAAMLWNADDNNYGKLARAFPEYFTQYKEMAEATRKYPNE